MTGITLNAVFILSGQLFMCSNDGSIYVETDLVKSVDGKSRVVNRTKNLRVKDAYSHGGAIDTDLPVVCLTRMATGNVFVYEGVISHTGDNGVVIIKLTSGPSTEKIEEIIKTIDSL